jgi:hypothetical protein
MIEVVISSNRTNETVVTSPARFREVCCIKSQERLPFQHYLIHPLQLLGEEMMREYPFLIIEIRSKNVQNSE